MLHIFNEVPVSARDQYLWCLMTSTTAFELKDSEHHNKNKSVIIVSQFPELCVHSLSKYNQYKT